MITKLRKAKEQLSDLVRRAAGGEEIISTGIQTLISTDTRLRSAATSLGLVVL